MHLHTTVNKVFFWVTAEGTRLLLHPYPGEGSVSVTGWEQGEELVKGVAGVMHYTVCSACNDFAVAVWGWGWRDRSFWRHCVWCMWACSYWRQLKWRNREQWEWGWIKPFLFSFLSTFTCRYLHIKISQNVSFLATLEAQKHYLLPGLSTMRLNF